MQTNNRNPQNQSITVIDLTEDFDDEVEIELLSSQRWGHTTKPGHQDSGANGNTSSSPRGSTPLINDTDHTIVTEDSIYTTNSTSCKVSPINDTSTIDRDITETATATSSNDSITIEDNTSHTGNVVPIDSSRNSESDEIATDTDSDDSETAYGEVARETKDASRTSEDVLMEVNEADDTTPMMDKAATDMNTADDRTTDINETLMETTTTSDTIMNTDNSSTINETRYQSYSLYRYDWSNDVSTCLASTQYRYNTTTNQSIAMDQNILQKPVKSSLLNRNSNNFFKSCHWSPDGTCLLTNSEDRMIRLFDVPPSIYDPSQPEPTALTPSLGILEGESVCDVAWFPSMNSQDPATCCFLSSVRDHPVRLWDATTGKVRASYCVVNHQERFIGPNVLKFNLDGTKIYCGYENMIEIFDVHAPGNNTSTKHSTTSHRKSRKGQKGIISCLDFNPDHSGMYAAGSYSQSIGIYDERTNELCLKLTGMKGGGVTQVKFSTDGNILYSSSRQSNAISCWDVRQSGNILYEMERKGKTNQRITFDLDPTDSVLITGDQDGHVLAYDLTTMSNEDVEMKARLLSTWDAHQDVVSTATFNPAYPSVMATCSGQRKFEIEQSDSDSNTDSDEMMVDNTLKIWQLAGQYEWYSMDGEYC